MSNLFTFNSSDTACRRQSKIHRLEPSPNDANSNSDSGGGFEGGGGRTIRRKREEGGTGERIWTSQFLVYENALLLTKYQKLTTIIAA